MALKAPKYKGSDRKAYGLVYPLEDVSSLEPETIVEETGLLRLVRQGSAFRVVTKGGSSNFVLARLSDENAAKEAFNWLSQRSHLKTAQAFRRFVLGETDSFWHCADVLVVEPYPTGKLRHHHWEEVLHPDFPRESQKGIFRIQARKGGILHGLRRAFGRSSHDTAYRIVLCAAPDFPCVAGSDELNDVLDVFVWLEKHLGCWPEMSQHQHDAKGPEILAKFKEKLRDVKVPLPAVAAAAPEDEMLHHLRRQQREVSIRKMDDDELSQVARRMRSLSENDPLRRTAAVVWNELAHRELQLMEERWKALETENVTVTIALNGAALGSMQVMPSWTGSDVAEQAKISFPDEIPSDAVAAPLIAPLVPGQTVNLTTKTPVIKTIVEASTEPPSATTPTPVVTSVTVDEAPAPPPPPAPPCPIPPPPVDGPKRPPLLDRPPLHTRRLPGCLIPNAATPTIWQQKLKQGQLQPLTLNAQDWRFGLDSSTRERTVIALNHDGTDRVEVVMEEDVPKSLLGVQRERNITIVLKGLLLHGLTDFDDVVSWIVQGKFPDDEIHALLAELSQPLLSVSPTSEEVDLFKAHPPAAREVRAERFIRCVIAVGVDKWKQGLATLQLWQDASETLQRIEAGLIAVESALKFVESDTFFALIRPIAVLILQVEGASNPDVNLPAAIGAVLSRKTTGVKHGSKPSLLAWLFSSNQFPTEALNAVDEGHLMMLDSAARVDQAKELGLLDELPALVARSIQTDPFVIGIAKQISDLKKTRSNVTDHSNKILLSFDPRPGKLSLYELFDSSSKLLVALKSLQAKDEQDDE